MNKYYDIISKNRPKSKRPAMEREKRAAQFAPFKALEGHEDAITEKARYVMNKKLLSQDHLDNLNYKLKNILKIENVKITVNYFEKDPIKIGGKYLEYTGFLYDYNKNKKALIFEDKEIYLRDIIDIKSPKGF